MINNPDILSNTPDVLPSTSPLNFECPSLESLSLVPFFGLQKLITFSLGSSQFLDFFKSNFDLRDKARLLSASGIGSGQFLNAIPVRADLIMHSLVFIEAVRLRLGITPICLKSLSSNDICPCGSTHNDVTSLINCQKAGGKFWIKRHDKLKFKLGNLCKASGYHVEIEETVSDTAVLKRKADVKINDWPLSFNLDGSVCTSAEVHVDVVITDPTNDSNVSHGSAHTIRGWGANQSAKKKLRSLTASLVSSPNVYIPGACETYGHIDKNFKNFLSDLAERHTYQSKTDAGLDISKENFLKNIFFNNYLQLISVTIQKSFVENLSNAIKIIKAHNIDCVPHTSNYCPAHRRNKLTVARMHAFLGTAERFGASDLSQFV